MEGMTQIAKELGQKKVPEAAGFIRQSWPRIVQAFGPLPEIYERNFGGGNTIWPLYHFMAFGSICGYLFQRPKLNHHQNEELAARVKGEEYASH